MQRLLLLAVLFSSLLTAGAQTDKPQRHKTTPQTYTTPAKPAPSKKQSQPTKHSTTPPAPKTKAPAKSTNPSAPTHQQPVGPTLSDPSGSYGGHDYVDLGLPSGTLWATCNVGATKPTEHGDYFAWGETKPKKYYDWDTYFDTSDGGKSFTKYNNSGGKTELDLSDDAAYVNWGSGWRMPSEAQLTELREKCIWTWYSKDGVRGYVVESKYNDSSLFLPAAGQYYKNSLLSADFDGHYWSRSTSVFFDGASSLGLYQDKLFISGNGGRYGGESVRPVRASASEKSSSPNSQKPDILFI